MRILSVVDRFLYRVVYIVLCIILALMVIVVCIQVVARGIGIIVPWTSEVTYHLMVVLTYLGMAAAYAGKEHICIDAFVRRLPLRWQRGVALTIELLTIPFFALFSFYAVKFAWANRQQSWASIDFSIVWVLIAIPVGTILVVLMALGRTTKLLMDWNKPTGGFFGSWEEEEKERWLL